MGTNLLDACANTMAANDEAVDAWPADLDDDRDSDINDVIAVGNFFGDPVPPAPRRSDVAPDPPNGVVDITDIAKVGAFFGKVCT